MAAGEPGRNRGRKANERPSTHDVRGSSSRRQRPARSRLVGGRSRARSDLDAPPQRSSRSAANERSQAVLGGEPRIPDEIVREVRQAARPGPAEGAEVVFRSAVARLAEGDAEAASAAATEAKRLAPRAAPIREVLGIALYRAGAYRTALSELLAYRRMTGRVDQNHLIA